MSRNGEYDMKHGFIPDDDCEKPMTNGDLIRQMTDEDLAEYIRVFFPEVCPPGNCPGEDCCYKCWLDWLKQEATSNGT